MNISNILGENKENGGVFESRISRVLGENKNTYNSPLKG